MERGCIQYKNRRGNKKQDYFFLKSPREKEFYGMHIITLNFFKFDFKKI